ncbi:MAG: ATP-binding protein [Oscillospiraceae bacterium]|nr:ATP-binding protein [Oscillospiraceae bacterium]
MTRNIWRSLQIKVIAILLLAIFSITTIIYFINFSQHYNLTIYHYEQDARNIFKHAERVIDERIFYEINTIEDQTSELFLEVHSRLDEIRRIAGIKFLYTVKFNDEGELIYLVDALDKDDKYFTHAGMLVEEKFTALLIECFEAKEPYFHNEIAISEYGVLYVTYFPYFDADGNVIGVVGIEFDAENVHSTINEIRIRTVLFSIIFACIFIIFSIHFVKREFKHTQSAFSSMEKSVKEANERASLMLNTSPTCAQIWDKNLNTIDCNEAAVKLYGFKDRQEYAEKFIVSCSPEYQPDGQRSDEKAVRLVNIAFEEGYCKFDWMHKMPNEDTFIPAEVILVRSNYSGETVVVGYTRDLREYNKITKDLEYRNELLQIVDQMGVLLYEADTDSFERVLHESVGMVAKAVKVDSVNLWRNHTDGGELYCTQIFDSSSKQLGFTAGEVFKFDNFIIEWRETLAVGKNLNVITREITTDTKSFLTPTGILSFLCVPIFIESEFWGFVCFDDYQKERIFDEAEETVMHSVSLLIANSFIRNKMILDIKENAVKLEAALGTANTASKAKGDFLSNMSHEIRTPLNAIIGMTSIAQKAENVTEKNKSLDSISEASSHLLSIINDILDMAKIEANKLELSPIEYNFEQMMQRIMTIIRFRSDEKQQNLNINIDEKIPAYIIGDDQRLSQVITNLLSNAVKFTPEGGVINLNASLVEDVGGSCELQIIVEDNGIGISPEQQSKLFNAFEQAESGISREYGGTGLGLAISKRVIELMGGQIKVESELNKGTRFTITVKAQRGNKTVKTNDKSLRGDTAGNTFNGKKLLVVEDVEINRVIILSFLKDTGIEIDCAANGKEALDTVTESPEKYDMILMDLRMPQMDGYEATRRIRELPQCTLEKLPIVAITANAFKEDIDACIAAGMNDHIAKPFDVEKVFNILRKYLAE